MLLYVKSPGTYRRSLQGRHFCLAVPGDFAIRFRKPFEPIWFEVTHPGLEDKTLPEGEDEREHAP